MDGEGFDANAWGWQASASSPADAAAARDGMDLNSQAPEEEGFPRLRLCGAFLQGDNDELPPSRVRGSGLPPYRPPRAGAGDAGATLAAPYDRQLQFGGSSSVATGHGGNNCVFPGVAQRANSAAAAPGHRNQRINTASLGGVGQRVPRPRAPRALRSAGVLRGQEEDHGPMVEEEEDDGGSTSNNLVQSQNLILQLVLGKYYVVDAGYPNRSGYLSPYKCTRYYVEQWQSGLPPQGMKETFNHAHAKVRNVIERSFGVLNMKFRILLDMPRFPKEKQTRIIVACMALHNFIRESKIEDRDFDACDADENYNPMPSSAASTWPADEPLVEDVNMNAFRDELAHDLFHRV